MKKKPAPKKKSQAKKPAHAKAAKPARKPAPPPKGKKVAAPAKTAPPKATKPPGKPAKTAAPAAPPAKPATPVLEVKTGKPAGPKPPKKGGRKSSLSQRRGPNGEPFVPGDLLLPTGPQGFDEVQYLLRGTVAAERANLEAGVNEIVTKQNLPDSERAEMMRFAQGMSERFGGGAIEPFLPNRPPSRRTFQGVVERAKHRRREIGAFLRGLDLGHTESSHMDSHGEASLQSLMEWAARLEILAEADEPDKADYGQFHRVLDQLDNTTEALIVDVELTLRRLRDRVRA